MLDIFRGIFNPDSAWERILRALIVFAAQYAKSQGWLPETLADGLTGGALLIGAGEKNK